MKINKLTSVAVLLPLSTLCHGEIIEVPNRCVALYQESGAIPHTDQCVINAATASVGLGTYQCTARPQWVGAYCNTLAIYDETPDDDNFTEYSVEPEADTTLLSVETGTVGSNCEGVADGTYLPTVPQPIDAYIGLASIPYSAASASLATINLVEGHEQAMETGDSSELFSNIYTITWGMVLPLGNVIGMDDIFQDLSQLADDFASGGHSCR